MVYTPTTWQDNVTVVIPSRITNIENELVLLDGLTPRIPPAAVAYGTSLPASPVDGQEAILVDSTTNSTYQWRFRYNAGSTSAYKWEYVGGTAVYMTPPAFSPPAGSLQTDTSAGGTFTTPRAGTYIVQAFAAITAASGASGQYMAAYAPNFNTERMGQVSSATAEMSLAHVDGITVPVNTAIQQAFFCQTIAITFSHRRTLITPMRVS